MAKTRALRRAEREAASALAQAKEARRAVRRRKRQALWRKLTLHDLRKRSSGKIARRSRGERAFIVVLTLAALTLIWYFSPSTAWAVALSCLLLLFLPVLVILIFDKRSA